ncbi:MAG: type II toxin-antitoxin system VapC family toxin [Gemmataceae bacterium]|nr:type II toxin-antitoxin system VapC family toxin [Gemmataceae bacterium]
MSLFLLDTDHLTHYQMGHPQVLSNVARHLTDQLAISVITVEEQLTGWQRALNQARDAVRREQIYLRMALAVESLASWSVLPFSLVAMSRHAALVRQRLNVGSNDLKIAATALERNAIVVTRNLRDFGRVAGLVCEDRTV